MRNILVWTSVPVSESNLQELLEEMGGHWNPDPTLRQGVLERGEAAIYTSVRRVSDSAEDAERVAAMGWPAGMPQAVIDIHVGHGYGSSGIAEELVRRALAKWPGKRDDLGTS